MLIILRRGSFRNKLYHLANTCEWHLAAGADEGCLAHEVITLCHHPERMKKVLSALLLDSWFKLGLCQDLAETHFHTFLGTLLKELRRRIQKACSEMSLERPGGLGVPISSHSHPGSKWFLAVNNRNAASLNFSIRIRNFITYNPKEAGLVQTPMDTYGNSNIY